MHLVCISAPNDTCLNAVSHHFSPPNRKLKTVQRSTVLLFYLNIPFWTDAIEDPAQVAIDCTYGQTNSELGLKSKRQHTGNWSAAAWPPRRVIAQHYSPRSTPHCALIHVRKNVGAFQNLISLFTVFEIALAGDFILLKSILTNLFFWGGGCLVPYATPLS